MKSRFTAILLMVAIPLIGMALLFRFFPASKKMIFGNGGQTANGG